MQKKIRDDELGPSNQKRPREAGYWVDDEDSNARSHPDLKMPKWYFIILKEEGESGELEDNEDWNPNYNPFFMKVPCSKIPEEPMRKLQKV